MEAKDRIIVALDVHDIDKAVALVKQLRDSIGGFKIGLQLIYTIFGQILSSVAYDSMRALSAAQELFELVAGFAFLDVKLKDIPNTVAGASRAIARLKPKMFNLHCDGGRKMMADAKKALEQAELEAEAEFHAKILGVTVLTSLSSDDFTEMGLIPGVNANLKASPIQDQKQQGLQGVVRSLALLAKEADLDGVIASAQEVALIRAACGPDFIIGTPGIRPLFAETGDQKRVTTPGDAAKAGADYQIIGRPITEYPVDKGGPVEAVRLIVEEIKQAQAS